MNAQHQAIIDAALGLPEAERALLLERLLEAAPPELDQFDDEQFAAELERRREELERDPAGAIPWSELQKVE